MSATDKPTIIKKYANRRLYHTGTSTYVTLDDLAEMVKKGHEFLVQDAKTGEDITRSVLTQIIFEQEGKAGQNLLPIAFLRQLIGYYGDSMQALVPSYLDYSIKALGENQQKFRDQMSTAFGPGSRHDGRACSEKYGDVPRCDEHVYAVRAGWCSADSGSIGARQGDKGRGDGS